MKFTRASNYSSNPHWDTPQKLASREDSVLTPYREHFGPSIPPNSQYWTMCGAHFTGKRGHELAANGEFHQHLAQGLYERHQFHGVDKDKHAIAMNRHFHPSVNWYEGDFLTTMRAAKQTGVFKPAIINYDSVHEPKKGGAYLRRLMHFVDMHVSDGLMLAANFVLTNPRAGRVFKPDDVIEAVEGNNYRIPDHWTVRRQSYVYGGGANVNSRCLMGTLIFFKAFHREVIVSKQRRLDKFA